MPFRYGIAVLTHLPHLFVRVRASIDDKPAEGVAADHLPPKWFTKVPDKDPEAEIEEMLAVIRQAASEAKEIRANTVFAFWEELYQRMDAWGGSEALPPLLTHFGTSLVERALIDAFCRGTATSFPRALRSGAFGIHLKRIHPELAESDPEKYLPAEPLKELTVRHTVGLGDPITAGEVDPADRIDDGLPQSLDEVIRFYGTRHFKIKIMARQEKDFPRLEAMAAVIARETKDSYAFTIDGNEQFLSAQEFREYWAALRAREPLRAFLGNLLFVEQPLHRDAAFQDEVRDLFANWNERPPVIIDESDGELHSCARALDWGYSGCSHKNCKGVIKGVANRALLAYRIQKQPGRKLVMSGEDLANIGPVALMQDMTVQACLGNASVERNGHHYFTGLSSFPEQIQQEVLRLHPDLYEPADQGWPRLRIQEGRTQIQSLLSAPFGYAGTIPLEAFDNA